MTLAPGRLFAGYRIEAVAARGGMGVVYRAVQEGLGRPVALKLIAPELARDPEFRARFVRESRLAASLDHPHVIPVYEAGEEDGSLFIAMRWVEGPDLHQRVTEQGPLPIARAGALVAQLAGALEAAHARGLVHRDVKPANVLLAGGDAAPHAYLSDFGIARSAESSAGLTRTGGLLGTAAFSSPEQIEGGAADGRADIYALGCVLFFALTGRPPFRRDTELATAWAQVHDQPPTLRSAGVSAPAALELALGRALAKDPVDRPASVGQLAREVLAATGATQRAAGGDSNDASADRSSARQPAATGGLPRIAGELDDDTPTVTGERSEPATQRLGSAPSPRSLARTVLLRRSRSRPRRALPWVAGLVVIGAVIAALALIFGGDDAGSGGGAAQSAPQRAVRPPAGPAAPSPGGDVVRCRDGVCRQQEERVTAPVEDAGCGDGGSWQRLDDGGDPALFACLGGASSILTAVPDVVGARLDRAESFLDERGLDHDTDGGGTFGIVRRSNWTVCETDPPAGAAVGGGAVTLAVDRSC